MATRDHILCAHFAMADGFEQGNLQYAAQFDKGDLGLPPAKKYLVVTCMDARVDPASQLGIELGDANIIRNAGGVACVISNIILVSCNNGLYRKDAIRSIVISQRLLGTREIALFHHTGCGMLTFNTPQLRNLVKDADPGNSAVSTEVDKIDFLEFPRLEEAVKEDVKFLQSHPLLLKDTKITGWIYSVETGKVSRVV